MRILRRRAALAVLLAGFAAVGIGACGDSGGVSDDGGADGGGGTESGSSLDAGRDATSDGATRDATANDAAPFDASGVDASALDAAATDAGNGDATASDAAAGDGASSDGSAQESGARDASGADAAADSGARPDAGSDAGSGIITGGPCVSGAPGAAAYRVRWINAGGQAQVVYEVDGLPDRSRDRAGAYGYQIGFTPSYVDPFLGPGGLQLDGSDFVDLEMSTVGVSSITGATIAIYGRSYSVDTNGSYNWQSFVDTGSTPTDFVSNVAPYQWYVADLGAAIDAGNGNVLLRIKAGLSSGALVVNRIEICMQAN